MDNLIKVSASVTQIDPSEVSSGGFEFANSNLIPSKNIPSSFSPQNNNSRVELFIYDADNQLIQEEYDYKDWKITQNSKAQNVKTQFTNEQGLIENPPTSSLTTDTIEVDPINDLIKNGVDTGLVYTLYNFIQTELGSNSQKLFYVDEISGDRTEIRLKTNEIELVDVKEGYKDLKNRLESSEYFDEFYLHFFNNIYTVCINIQMDGDSVLIKLLEPLDEDVEVKDFVFVVTKPGETVGYEVEFEEDYSDFINNATYIKGPNINISLTDLVNNSTPLQSYDDLVDTPSSESFNSVMNYLNQTGVTITPNYSRETFDEFVNFSSAKQRVLNFYEKVTQIQNYKSNINVLDNTTSTTEVSESIASLETKITNIVSNFDGYENYLYYDSGSDSYPKIAGQYPYDLVDSNNEEVLNWLGSDDIEDTYYGGYLLAASDYDQNNQDWLYYTIPEFLRSNSNNDNYITFANMVGQHFDEIWMYTKALSERFNTTNNPDTGLPLNLAKDAIKHFGFEAFGNNYNNQDNFIGLTGEDNGSYVPSTGEELILNYIAVNGGQVLNYWELGYALENYVESINDPGWPYAIDKVSKEIYKRLYHNMAYLTKKKGTISGLRQLINIWGIPNTILRINEFGGKNRDNSNDYDLWYNRYSTAYTAVASNNYQAGSSLRMPWMPLHRNHIETAEYIVPDSIAFRFKTPGYPSNDYNGEYYSQSLIVKKSDGVDDDSFDFGVGLFYEEQPVGSYSGSSNSDYHDYGKLRLYMSGSGGVQVSNDIELPFFDGGWWSVLLQRDTHTNDNNDSTTYTLYAANKINNGWDGNQIGWTGSVSMSSDVDITINNAWNNFGVSDNDGIILGGKLEGSNVSTVTLNEDTKAFSGSFQEFRYYSNDISENVFYDFVMNPESIEGNNITGSESSFDIVNFRAPLGNELEHPYTASDTIPTSDYISSSHPAISAKADSLVTQSFINPSDSSLTSSYEFIYFDSPSNISYSRPNTEVYFLDQPAIGIRNRVSNKVRVEDGDAYGNVLSPFRSIDQNYLISQSYTEDVTNLEVGFSPQDEVNDDIIASFGYGVISDTIADPRFNMEGNSNYYPNLRRVAEDYFKKYKDSNVWNYLRLIKYFDNSIFKAIKSYVPARTSVTTGIIVKQHMLERNRRVPINVTPDTTVAYTIDNDPILHRNLEVEANMTTATITGSMGQSVPDLEGQVSASGPGFNFVAVTQSWDGTHETPTGLVQFTDHTQNEFFNGEFSGSSHEVHNGIALNNPYAPSNPIPTNYNISVTSSVGQWTFEDGGTALTTYPSFSLDFDITTLVMSTTTPGGTEQIQPDYDLDDLKAQLSVDGADSKAFIVLAKNSNVTDGLNDFYSIKALAIPLESRYFNGADISNLPKTLFNTSKDFKVLFPNDIPQPLTSQYPFSVPSNNLGPYFKMELDSNTTTASSYGTEGGISNGVIVSPALGDREGIIRDYYNTLSTTYALYYWVGAVSTNQRPVKIESGESFNATGGTGKIYISNFDLNYKQGSGNTTTEFGKSWFKQQQSNPPGLGSGSLFLQGTTWTGSFGDSGYFAPFGLVLNDKNEDSNGNIINNQNTLANNPTFNFNVLESSSGIPAVTDEYGLDGKLFVQESASYTSFNIAVNDPTLSGFGFEYNPVTSRGLSGSYEGFTPDGLYLPTGSQPLQYVNFFPQIPETVGFINTPYDVLINNASENVENTHIQVIEYDNGPIPSNIDAIISGVARKANIPDSFYTQLSNITPRYLGSKLLGAENYTTSSNETSRATMKSTGTSVNAIWNAPIYFAHFESSKENYELWDSYTFDIDALIEVPLEDITGDRAPELPTIIKVDGSGDNISEVRSTFEVGRDTAITYNPLSGSLVPRDVGTFEIYQGSMEYKAIASSEKTQFDAVSTGSFITSSQCEVDEVTGYEPFYLTEDNLVKSYLGSSLTTLVPAPSPDTTPPYKLGSDYWMSTGSGFLELNGGALAIRTNIGSAGDPDSQYEIYFGDSLALIHTFNKWVYNKQTASSRQNPGLSPELADQFDNISGSKESYFRFNFQSSDLDRYEEFDEPFLIKKNDEIRVTYDIAGDDDESPNYITQDFLVISEDSDTDNEVEGANLTHRIIYEAPGSGINSPTLTPFTSTRFKVHPDPSTLNIPDGEIDHFTIRRRMHTDDKVVVFRTPPSGSQGILSETQGGYLIPNDMTPIQKKNVQSLITQLNAKNTFKDE